jgi:hypothetical protein
MFPVDMETHTPTPAQRYATIRGRMCLRLEAEGPRYNIARMVDLLILELLTWMISWCINRAERDAERQASQDDARAEPEWIGAVCDEGGDRRRADSDVPDVGRRVVVRAAVTAADGMPVFDGATEESCIRDEGDARAAAGPRQEAAFGPSVTGVDYGFRVLRVRFAKIELWTKAELRQFRCDIEISKVRGRIGGLPLLQPQAFMGSKGLTALCRRRQLPCPIHPVSHIHDFVAAAKASRGWSASAD